MHIVLAPAIVHNGIGNDVNRDVAFDLTAFWSFAPMNRSLRGLRWWVG